MSEMKYRASVYQHTQPAEASLNAYQRLAFETAIYPELGQGSPLAREYVLLGLAGEVGELVGKYKKLLRGDETYAGPGGEWTLRDDMEDELGDVLWYCAQLATELGFSLEDVAERNINKLADRQKRGVIRGSGDKR